MAHHRPYEVREVEIRRGGKAIPLLEESLCGIEAGEEHGQARHWEIAVSWTADIIVHGNLVQEYFDQVIVKGKNICFTSA